MNATTVSLTSSATAAHPRAVGRRDLAMFVFLLFGTFAVDAAVLLAAAGLTGFAWSDLGWLVVPPVMAGSGAVLTFFALNQAALRSEVATAGSPRDVRNAAARGL